MHGKESSPRPLATATARRWTRSGSLMMASAGVLALGGIAVRAARSGSLSGASDVMAVRTDATTITVAWTDISRAARGWSVMAQGSFNGPWEQWREIQVTPQRSAVRRLVKFENVPEKRVFRFRVIGHYRLGNFRGFPASAVVSAVSALPHTPTSVVGEWTRSRNDIYVAAQNLPDWEWSYRIYISKRPDGAWELNNDMLGTRNPSGRILLQLDPMKPLCRDTEYCVRVVAWNPLGEAQPSEWDCGRTLAT
jgi:hypothetical protein